MMGKIRRGGYQFVTWIGDHAPRHVHIYDGKKFIAKWNLERNEVIVGSVNRKIVKIIKDLQKEGLL